MINGSTHMYFFCDHMENYSQFFSSIEGGEIAVYGLTETAWHIPSVGLHVEKHRHDYRLKQPLGRQDQKTT